MLAKFRRCSGLELNKSKTEAMWLGPWAGRKEKPFGFRWPEVSAHALGIHFTNDSSTSDKLKFRKEIRRPAENPQLLEKEEINLIREN